MTFRWQDYVDMLYGLMFCVTPPGSWQSGSSGRGQSDACLEANFEITPDLAALTDVPPLHHLVHASYPSIPQVRSLMAISQLKSREVDEHNAAWTKFVLAHAEAEAAAGAAAEAEHAEMRAAKELVLLEIEVAALDAETPLSDSPIALDLKVARVHERYRVIEGEVAELAGHAKQLRAHAERCRDSASVLKQEEAIARRLAEGMVGS